MHLPFGLRGRPEPVTETVIAPGVVMRLPRPADAPALSDAYIANRQDIDRWSPAAPDAFYTVAGQLEHIAQARRGHDVQQLMPWILVRDGRVAGSVTLFGITRGPLQQAMLGYWIDTGERGRGLATSAVRAAVAFARDDLRLHRLEAGAAPDNLPSRRVLEKTGFREIGLAPSYLFANGVWQDEVLYQIVLAADPPDEAES